MKKRKGLSHLVAAIILVAITLIGGIIAYSFASGTLFTQFKKTEVAFEYLGLYKSGGEPKIIFAGTIKNIGAKPIVKIIVQLHNESEYLLSKVSEGSPLEPGKCVGFALTEPDIHADWYIIGNAYSVQVYAEATDKGSFAHTTTVRCLGTSGPGSEATPKYLYVGTWSSPARVLKIDAEKLTILDRLIFPSGFNKIYYDSVVRDGDYLYFGFYTEPGRIAKVDLKTFSMVDSLVLPNPNYDYASDLAIKNNKLYVAGEDYAAYKAIVHKIDLPTFTYEDNLLLDGDAEATQLAVYDNYLFVGYWYFEGGTHYPATVKIDLETFTKVASLNFVYDMIVIGDYLYTCGGNKIDIETFTIVDTVSVPPYGHCITSDGAYLYIPTWTVPAKIYKIDIATFTLVDILTLDSGENNALACTADEDYLYVSLYTSPGKIVQIDLATFEKVKTLELDPEDKRAYALILVEPPVSDLSQNHYHVSTSGLSDRQEGFTIAPPRGGEVIAEYTGFHGQAFSEVIFDARTVLFSSGLQATKIMLGWVNLLLMVPVEKLSLGRNSLPNKRGRSLGISLLE